MKFDREHLRTVALNIVQEKGSVIATDVREKTMCTTQLGVAVLKDLRKDGLLERRLDRSSSPEQYRYFPVREDPMPADRSAMGAALFDLCDPNSNPNFSMGVEMDVERIDLETDLLSLRERLTLDLTEEGYCYGVKYALDTQDWASVQAHLECFEEHLKEKYDRVHKLLVRVRRQNRRK